MRNIPDSRVCRCWPVPHLRACLPFRNRYALVGVLLLAAFAGVAQDSQPAATPAQTTQGAPDAVTQPAIDSAKTAAGSADERKKQITNDSSQLLTMAIALKAEVDKTNKDTLSLNVIRKADEIEKLARSVKEKIKQSPGPG